MTLRILCALCIVCGSFSLGQIYKCDWSVNGIGGGDVSSTAYRCGATVGQTAVGFMSGPAYRALIGFWQAVSDTTGIRDMETPVADEALRTRLEAIAPNPCPGRVLVRYAVGSEGLVSLVVHDLAGRQVRVLANGNRRPGRYVADWRGDDDAGRKLGNGIYFCRFVAGETRATRKLILAR